MKQRSHVYFDVKNKEHVNIYKGFLANSKWGADGCPFELEEPFISIPSMIQDKLVRHFLKV